MQITARERPPLKHLALSRTHLVVGEYEVTAAPLQVESWPKEVQGDGCALDMPPRPTRTDDTDPTGLPFPRCLPQQRVHRVALPGPPRIAATLSRHLDHICVVQVTDTAEPGGRRDVEVQVLPHLVGGPGATQLSDPGGCAVDRLHRAQQVRRRQDPQRHHVIAEPLDLEVGQLPPVNAVAGGPLKQGIIDVRHVLHILDLVPGETPEPVHSVEQDVGCRMPNVGGVVRRDPADVHPRPRPWIQRAHLRTRGIESGEIRSDLGQGWQGLSGPGTHQHSLAGWLRSAARAARASPGPVRGIPGRAADPGRVGGWRRPRQP